MGRLAACVVMVCGLFAEMRAEEKGTQIKEGRDRFVPGHQKKMEVRIGTGTANHVTRAMLTTAVGNAIATWNAKLGSRLQLVPTAPTAAIPRGELHVSISASDLPQHFPPGSTDLAMTGTLVYKQGNYALRQIVFNDTQAFANSGGFSTTGAPNATIDLEITLLHELGHTLGIISHLLPTPPVKIGDDLIPPIMRPLMEANELVVGHAQMLPAHAGKTIAQLRRLDPADEQALTQALDRRERLRLHGNFIIRGEVTAAAAGSAATPRTGQPRHTLTIRGLNFDDTTGEIGMTYQGERMKAPMSDYLLINDPGPLEFKDLQAKHARSLRLTRNNQDRYMAKMVVVPTRYEVTVEGPLEKVP